MLSELIMVSGLLMLLMLQDSSLYMSLILIPLSAVLMLSLGVEVLSSAFFMFLFVLIFIGGLLILLTSVASILSQEQANSALPSGILVGLLGVLVVSVVWGGHYDSGTTSMGDVVYWTFYEGTVIFWALLSLLLALTVITYMFTGYRGLIQGSCFYGVMHSFVSSSSSG